MKGPGRRADRVAEKEAEVELHPVPEEEQEYHDADEEQKVLGRSADLFDACTSCNLEIDLTGLNTPLIIKWDTPMEIIKLVLAFIEQSLLCVESGAPELRGFSWLPPEGCTAFALRFYVEMLPV
ncbi:uncharacterized protein A4U43_C03F8870 [Asparagus officinalis]|uniref:Uncharacterized protein n=1 Tax=Asparagus officinalis TaxID=4686 RepID=A0A5P1F8L2_ASPOF|nr:uncharacterized protein A4U43_C03F8870 [Asparagus officinalis]